MMDLYDTDEDLMCLPAMHLTRGRARAIFTSNVGVRFTVGRVVLQWFRRDHDFEREQREDGIEPQPTFVRCAKTASSAQPYWVWLT